MKRLVINALAVAAAVLFFSFDASAAGAGACSDAGFGSAAGAGTRAGAGVCSAAGAGTRAGAYSRKSGVIARVGVGIPGSVANADLGVGYQFGPHFALTAEAFSFSGLTSIAGVIDARYYALDRTWTPFIDAKAGFGLLGKDMSYRDCYGDLAAVTAGLSWRGFDLGAGVSYDAFHRLAFVSNLSWTIHF